jgi:hypothetical protein
MSRLPAVAAGEPVELVAFDGKLFKLVSPRAFAPGQPLRVEVALASTVVVDLKSIGCVRRQDGRFELRARAATLPRPAREALLAALVPP